MVTRGAAAIIVVGAVACFVLGNGWVGLAFAGLAALGVGADLLLAGAIRDLTLRRDGDTQIRLGDTATVTLTIANAGARTVVADVRDAWVPSAGASVSPRCGTLSSDCCDPSSALACLSFGIC